MENLKTVPFGHFAILAWKGGRVVWKRILGPALYAVVFGYESKATKFTKCAACGHWSKA